MINSISYGFSDKEQIYMNGHSTLEQIRSYSSINIVDISRKCFNNSLCDEQFYNDICNNSKNLFIKENLVNNGTGYCNEDCQYVNMNCLNCNCFHTTIQNLPALIKMQHYLQHNDCIDNEERLMLLERCQEFILALRQLSNERNDIIC